MIVNMKVMGKNQVENANNTISYIYTLTPTTQTDTTLTVQGQILISTANTAYANAHAVNDIISLTI